MDSALWLTRGTAWLALTLYAAAEAAEASSRARGRRAARALQTAGCAVFLGHVVAAFHFHHGWSHAAAVEETARQTEALTGLRWGGGLHLNYLFALVWLADVAWRWAAADGWARRPACLAWAVRGWFLFMIVNGAVVFVRGPARWYGLLLCAVLAASWGRPARAVDRGGGRAAA